MAGQGNERRRRRRRSSPGRRGDDLDDQIVVGAAPSGWLRPRLGVVLGLLVVVSALVAAYSLNSDRRLADPFAAQADAVAATDKVAVVDDVVVAGDVAVADAVEPSRWSMTVEPPQLDDPLEFVIDESTALKTIDDFDDVGCDGVIYQLTVPPGRDARVTADPAMGPLRYPVWITGGRHVHVSGLELRPIIQDGCAVGEAHQIRDPQLNIHPRLASGKVIRLEQSGTSFVEGVDIDLIGMEADCFVSRNPAGTEVSEALQNRVVMIVNTRCVGIEGLDDSPIGDGIHGDFFQNQGRDDVGTLMLENVTILSSSNGITFHNWSGSENRPRLFQIRNMDYGWDSRYANDDAHEISGLGFTGSADVTEFEGVYLNDPRGLNYGIVNGERVGAFSQSGHITRHMGMHAGRPEQGDFAPEAHTGHNYASPFITGAAIQSKVE